MNSFTDPQKPSFSISLGPAKPKPPPRKPASTFAPKRSAAHLDSDDEDHADDSHTTKVQLVTAFDSTRGGAVDLDDTPKQDSGPLVIPKLSNRNWREEAERRRGGKKAIYLPPEALAKQQGGGVKPEDLVETDKTEQKYGLQVFDRTAEEPEPEPTVPVDTDAPPPPPPQTEEEIALSALLRGDVPGPSTLVLAPVATSNGNDWRAARAAVTNEDAAFKTDVASRPEMATLEDYAAVPVEEFGAALLRGMGWKEGDEVGKRRGKAAKPRVVEKRPAFLGIGAKAKEEALELGTWGKGDKRRKRHDTTYVPVVMVDKKTGKIIDPAEAEAVAAAAAAANGKEKGERGEGNERIERGDRDRDRDEPPRRERSRDRDRDRRDRKDHERSYNSSDRRRRDRDHDKDRSRDHGKDRDRERRRGDDDRDRRRGDDDCDRRRGDDRRRDDRRDRDRDRRDRR